MMEGSNSADPATIINAEGLRKGIPNTATNSLPQNTSINNVHNAENMVGDFVESDGFDIAGVLNDVVPNAEYSADGKTIRVSTASKDPFMVSVLHEAVHALKRGNAKQYGILNENLKMFLRTNPKVFSGVIADLAGRYTGSDGKVNRDTLDEEFTAKMLSYILDNKKTVKRLARENMNIFEKVQDSVLALSDASLERYSTLNYGEDSDIAVVAKKLDEYRNEFLDAFVEGGEGYYRSSGYTVDGDKYSLGYTNNDEIVVIIKKDIFEGKKKREWANIAKKTMAQFSPGITINGTFIAINKYSRKEFAFSDYSDIIMHNDVQKYKDKLSLSDNVDEVLVASLNYQKEIPKHKRTDNIVNFARGDLLFKVGKNKYKANVIIGITKDGGYVFHDIVDINDYNFSIKKVGDLHSASTAQLNNQSIAADEASSTSKHSLPRNASNNNVNIAENSVTDFVESNQVDTSTDSIANNTTIERIFRRESMRYGLGNISVEELPGVSFAQRDIDARLGREFMFEDNSVTSQVKDKLGNSLHLSDTVIFDNGERASVSTGAGRILGFDENANIIIAVDAGTGFGSTATVPADQVTFVMHNTPESIGRDFETSNGMYGKAKRVFDEFIKTGDVSVLDSFGYNNARYYLMASEEKVRTIATKLQKITS